MEERIDKALVAVFHILAALMFAQSAILAALPEVRVLSAILVLGIAANAVRLVRESRQSHTSSLREAERRAA